MAGWTSSAVIMMRAVTVALFKKPSVWGRTGVGLGGVCVECSFQMIPTNLVRFPSGDGDDDGSLGGKLLHILRSQVLGLGAGAYWGRSWGVFVECSFQLIPTNLLIFQW